MEGKLIKTDGGFFMLFDENKNWIGVTGDSDGKKLKLSFKNCQAIERGYDLDELFESIPLNSTNPDLHKPILRAGFIVGFQKALEILGDKKFSEKDIERAFIQGVYTKTEIHRKKEEYIKSLQQTEWDVEIEMICPHPSDTYRCGMEYGCDADGCNHPNKVPYLDSDGCLILKRK